jgi:hypothetical protein
LQHIQPVAPGHGNVQQHHAQAFAAAQGRHGGQHLGPVGGLGADFDVWRIGQHLLEPLAHDAVVVSDQHTDRTRSLGSGLIRY